MEYWKTETPIKIDTGANILRYFKTAGKLQVCLPDYTDKDGKTRQGKTVAVDIDALCKSPQAVELLSTLCN